MRSLLEKIPLAYAALCFVFWIWLMGHVFHLQTPPSGFGANLLALEVFVGSTVFALGGSLLSVQILRTGEGTKLHAYILGALTAFGIQIVSKGPPTGLGWLYLAIMFLSLGSAYYYLIRDIPLQLAGEH